MQVCQVVLHNLRQSDQTLLKDMSVGHLDVTNVLRRERGSLGGVLGIDLVRRRRDLHLLVQLLRVVHCEIDFVRPGVESELLARKEEEALLANFHLVTFGGKIANSEAPCAVGFRFVGFSAAILKSYLRGPNRHPILVHHGSRALSRIRCPNPRESKNTKESQPCRQYMSRP